MPNDVSKQSLDYVLAIPDDLRKISSIDLNWTALLVTNNQVESQGFGETTLVDDLFISIVTRGAADIKYFEGGWQRRRLAIGSMNMIGGPESVRMGWKVHPGSCPLESTHIFIPSGILLESAEHFRKPGCRSPVTLTTAFAVQDETIARAGQALLSAMQAGVPNVYAQATAQWLAVHLLQSRTNALPSADWRRPGNLSTPRMLRLIEFIDAHLGSELDLEVLATEAGVSKFHFIRLFRQQMGESPIRYISKRRVERAAWLLRQNNLSIKSIAYACGYKSASHFSTAFFRHFGSAPSEFRRRK